MARWARVRATAIRCSVTERESHTAPACDSGVVGGRAEGFAHHHLERLQPAGSALAPIYANGCSRRRSGWVTLGPDPVARSLRTRKAGAVGLVMTEPLTYFFSDPAARDFVAGVAQSCEELGQGLLLVAVGPSRSLEDGNGRRARRRGGRLRGVFGLRRRSLSAGGAAAAAAGRGGRSAQGPVRSVPGGHRRPGGDARARRLRARAGASRDRVADHAAGPGPPAGSGGRRAAAVADLRRAARTHHRRVGGDDGRRCRPGFADRGGKLRAPARRRVATPPRWRWRPIRGSPR